MRVFRVLSIVAKQLVWETTWPSRSVFRPGDLVGVLTGLGPSATPADMAWQIDVMISEGPEAQKIPMALEPFLSDEEYALSSREPIPLSSLASLEPGQEGARWLWLFRNALYVAERLPHPMEMDECSLQVKAVSFRQDEVLRRLREEVANYEAIERNQSERPIRPGIPDDVKLAVWSRDGGACVRCGATVELHFDHVIPFSRGGGSTTDNLQLLCRTCNLSKSNRIV